MASKGELRGHKPVPCPRNLKPNGWPSSTSNPHHYPAFDCASWHSSSSPSTSGPSSLEPPAPASGRLTCWSAFGGSSEALLVLGPGCSARKTAVAKPRLQAYRFVKKYAVCQQSGHGNNSSKSRNAWLGIARRGLDKADAAEWCLRRESRQV